MSALRRGPVFREADVPVPPKWKHWAFEYRIGYDAGTRFKKYFPTPGADTWRHTARLAFRAGWNDARKGRAPTAAVSPSGRSTRQEIKP